MKTKKRSAVIANKILLGLLVIGVVLISIGFYIYHQDAQKRSSSNDTDNVSEQTDALVEDDADEVDQPESDTPNQQNSEEETETDQQVDTLSQQIATSVKKDNTGGGNTEAASQKTSLVITAPPLNENSLAFNLRLLITNLNQNIANLNCSLTVTQEEETLVSETAAVQRAGSQNFCKFAIIDMSKLTPPSADSPWQINYSVGEDLATIEKRIVSWKELNV